jgi:M6 family metalloprotease-like protein
LRFFLILLAGLALVPPALLASSFPALTGDTAESSPRLLRVRTLHEITSERAAATPPGVELVSKVLRRRAVKDCFGNPGMGRRVPFLQQFSPASAETVITIRILALRVDFLEDRMGPLTTTEGGNFDLRRGTTEFIDPPPHNRDYFTAHMEALSRYWSAASFGTLEFEYTVFPEEPDSAFHLSDTADYGPWTFTFDDYALAVRLVTDAVTAADNSPEPIVFSQYDMVVIFHSGGELQGDINGDSPWDIPSFTIGLEEPIPVDNSASSVGAAMVVPETASQDGITGAVNGVVVHEFGHMLGLPDLYDTDNFLPSVGYWSLMDTGNYLGGFVENPTTHELVYVFGLIPGGLDPWCRKELENIFGAEMQDETPVGAEWSDTLRAVGLSPTVLSVPASATEYFLIENRQSELDGNGVIEVTADSASGVILGPESNEYDALLPGSGILVWHIDEGLIALRSSLLMSPNGGLYERGIDLEEADGVEDLGNPYSWYWLGSEFDPYFEGNATLLGPATVPNSNVNSGARSQVVVDVGSPRQVGMYVTVKRTWAKEGWPVLADGAGDAVFGLADFNGDGVSEIFAATSDSTVKAWTADGSTYLSGETNGDFAAAPGSILPVLCYSEEVSAIAGTVIEADSGALYGWVLNDSHLPSLPGDVLAGWPPTLPSVTTSPCASGAEVVVGCSDGRVYAVDAAGAVAWNSDPVLGGDVRGSIAAGDIDGDGYYEVAFGAAERLVAVVSSADGQLVFPPLTLPETWGTGSPGPFVVMADVDGKPDSTLEVLVTTTSGSIYAFDAQGAPLEDWPVALGDSVASWPAAGDVDGDGLVELTVLSSSGKLYVVNGTGVVSTGWPISTGGSDAGTSSGVSLCDLSGDGASEMLFTSADSEGSAVTGDGTLLEGWPVAIGAGAGGALAIGDVEGDGKLELFHAAADTLVWCMELPYLVSECEWPVVGRSSARTNCLQKRAGLAVVVGSGLIVNGRAHCQPNPVRGGIASIRFSLASSATVSMEIFDLSGRRVHRAERFCGPAENAFLWRAEGFPPGVYVVRIEAESVGRKEVAFTKASVLH